MSGTRRYALIAMLFCATLALACGALAAPATSEAADATHVYPNGIETIRLENGITVAADHRGLYALGFPEHWDVGAFHADFIPTVELSARTNPAVQSFFDTMYGHDEFARIFAIDTSAAHLTPDNMAVIHIGMFQGEPYAGRTLDELTAEYAAYLQSNGRIEIKQTLVGKSRYDVPFVILLTQSEPANGSPVYSAVALIQTDDAYLEMLYTTLDASIDIANELNTILYTFSTIVE